MSGFDPSRVKTRASQNPVESNSRWRISERDFVRAGRIILRIRDRLSMNLANAWFFAQPGPRPDSPTSLIFRLDHGTAISVELIDHLGVWRSGTTFARTERD